MDRLRSRGSGPALILSGDSNVATIAVTVDGYLQDDGNLQLIIEGLFGSNDNIKYEETIDLSSKIGNTAI